MISIKTFKKLKCVKLRDYFSWALELTDASFLGSTSSNKPPNSKEDLKQDLYYQSWQKSYANNRRKPLEFQEEEHIFLKVTPTMGIGRAKKVRKLFPRFIGPFQILKRVGPIAYQIVVRPNLSNIYNVFHVSQLR